MVHAHGWKLLLIICYRLTSDFDHLLLPLVILITWASLPYSISGLRKDLKKCPILGAGPDHDTVSFFWVLFVKSFTESSQNKLGLEELRTSSSQQKSF